MGSPLHVHHNEDEWFYIPEGELTLWAGGRVIIAPAGSFVFGPRDIPHTFMVSPDQARFLLVAEPGGFEKFLRELSQPADAADDDAVNRTTRHGADCRYGREVRHRNPRTSGHSYMKNGLNFVAVAGLALGGVFGMAGTLVSEPNFRAIFWGIDSTGLVVATALLALKFFRRENDVVAAGFLVFAIGEAVMLSATA